MQAVTIHKASATDAAAIAAMAQELAAYEGEVSLVTADSIAALLASDTAPLCECLIAKNNKEVIGFVLYYAGYDLSSDSYGFHLADMLVQEAYRGSGIGKQLLAALAVEAREQSREWVSLTALRGNRCAKYFYEACGFSEVDVTFFAIGPAGLRGLEC